MSQPMSQPMPERLFLEDLAEDPAILIPENHIDLPDFVLPQYPFDLPPYRRAFFTRVFEAANVPATCKVPACRRSRRCQGEDGPPCYRADRKRLSQLLQAVYVACNCLDGMDFVHVAMMLELEFRGTGRAPTGAKAAPEGREAP